MIPALLIAALAAGMMQPVPAAPRDPALLTYLRMGGDIADICGEVGHRHGSLHCAACRLIGPAVLPEPSRQGQPLRVAYAVRGAEPPHARPRTSAGRSAWTPRAPPPGRD